MTKNKMKTHKGLSKVSKVRNSGSVKITNAGKNHKSGKKNATFNRTKRGGQAMSTGDIKRVKTILGK